MGWQEASEPNEFDAFETGPEILAYVATKYGADALQQLLQMMLEQSSHTTREDLEDYGAELHEIGLTKAAAIVREAAQNALPETDLSFCPYGVEPYVSSKSNQLNIDAWLGGVKAQRQRKRAKKLLAAAGSPAA